MNIKTIIEVIEAAKMLLHASKPLMFELVLFVWAAYEMWEFIVRQVVGGGQ